ncbi:MAG: Wzz/FepE/Etk N-terminal domain-containing protein [Candidatus Aminicenantales bacterium]
MNKQEDEVDLMDYLAVVWKRKWLIIISTVGCAILAGVVSFLLPPQWEVDTLILPARFQVQPGQGQYVEVLAVDPVQVATEIMQEAYNSRIAAELNLDLAKFPKLKVESLKDTKLTRISIADSDVGKAKSILSTLFVFLKIDFDKKLDIEIKNIDSQTASEIELTKNQINYKELIIKDNLNKIKLLDIEINKAVQKVISTEKLVKISEERGKNIVEEMKTAKARIDEIDAQQKISLTEKKEGAEALGLLLYTSEIQHNLIYYDALDEKLSNNKISQENLRLSIEDKKEDINKLNTMKDNLRNEIDKVKIKIENILSQIKVLSDKKARFDYTQLVKEPTRSLYPIAPRKKRNVLIAGLLGAVVFTMLAFLLEYVEKRKND